MNHTARRAFTLMEVLVVIGIIALLMAILLPTMEKVRHQGYIAACASNLRQLGQGMQTYANQNHGELPRTVYVAGAPLVAGTGAAAPDAFVAGGPQPNDITAAIWLMMRFQKLPTKFLICPYNDVNEFEPDKAQPLNQANFTDYKKSLGYSYANPYPDAAAVLAGSKATLRASATVPLMADLNPGINALRKSDPFRPNSKSSMSEMRYGNSANHEREGQNVLYGDGHVNYEFTPFVGPMDDNIYTSQNAVSPNLMVSPAGPADAVLLSVD